MKRVHFKDVGPTGDPHTKRRAEISLKYPDVSKLMKIDPWLKWQILLNIGCQILCCAAASHFQGWGAFLLFTYTIGATLTHSLFLAIHELSHNAAFDNIRANQYLAIAANLPVGIPYATTFKRYHMLHHTFFGQETFDTDIATELECYLVSSSATCYIDHCFRKALYTSLYTFVYALRPVLVAPQVICYDRMFFTNLAAQILFNILMVRMCGTDALTYMLLSTVFAGSLHPLGGRFLAEHLHLQDSIETYSYYGILNYFLFNIGFHEAHHDFPSIPCHNLPALVKMAPEYYSEKSETLSWISVQLRFIFDDSIGPASRIKRTSACTQDDKKN